MNEGYVDEEKGGAKTENHRMIPVAEIHEFNLKSRTHLIPHLTHSTSLSHDK